MESFGTDTTDRVFKTYFNFHILQKLLSIWKITFDSFWCLAFNTIDILFRRVASEAAARRCSYDKAFRKYATNLQERIVKINIWWSNQYTEAAVQMFLKIVVLQNFSNFTGKHLCRSLFSNVAGLKACNFVKKRLQHWCFPVKFAKI